MRILFVEDTDVFINRFKPQLEKLGEVNHFKSSNGARASMKRVLRDEESEEFNYDLIVCDHNILRFEKEHKTARGTEVYHELRRWGSETVPFIHFSAAPCPEEYDANNDSNFYTLGKNYDSDLIGYGCIS